MQISGVVPAFLPVKKDTDGKAYLNTVGYALAMAFNEIEREKLYAARGVPNPDPYPKMWREWPCKVKQHVETLLNTYPAESPIYEKFEWFARYFNDAYFNNEIRGLNDGPGTSANSALACMAGTYDGVGNQFCDPIVIPGDATQAIEAQTQTNSPD